MKKYQTPYMLGVFLGSLTVATLWAWWAWWAMIALGNPVSFLLLAAFFVGVRLILPDKYNRWITLGLFLVTGYIWFF